MTKKIRRNKSTGTKPASVKISSKRPRGASAAGKKGDGFLRFLRDPRKRSRLILCTFIGVLLLLTAILALAMPQSERVGMAQKPADPTPTPSPVPTEVLVRYTASPTPVTVTIEQEVPEGAVNVMAKDRVLFMMRSAEEAAQLISDYLAWCGSDGVAFNEWLLKAAVSGSVTLVPADGSAEMLSYDAAMTRLQSNAQLLPVVRTVARCETVSADILSETAENPQLPVGTRLVRTWGSPEIWIVYTETMFKDGVECSCTETNRFKVSGATAPNRVETGTYVGENPDGEPRRDEGEQGRTSDSLSILKPMSGTIISYFGMRYGKMHYGVDISNLAATMILAPEDGIVIFCGERGNYGYVVDILHDETGFVSRLSHLDGVRVELWERVKRGEQIANLVDAVDGKKPYLHYELIIDGVPYDPAPYLNRR